ncbi:MAG: cytochrome c biogenesis protein ResB [Halobacteriovoraceae bacterium]|nr:cytochrome c biogenesis protein ResB [Halobacteriovoraceae bacterium]
MKIKIKKLLTQLCDTRIFFISTGWLMVLLLVGTIAQKEIGLHQAQVKYFSSLIWWLGPLPLPGGATTMTVIFVGLLSKLTFKTSFKKKNIGIAITHFGSFLLLSGGILTGMFSYEGSMVIPEGQTSSYIQDYHKLELSIIDTSPKEKNITYAFGDGFLEEGSLVSHSNIPFSLEILKFCKNCEILQRENPSDEYKGFAKRFEIQDKKLDKEDSENRSGAIFKVTGSDNDGIYMAVETMPVEQTVTAAGKIFNVGVRHKRYQLPFSIELIDFEKKVHAATSMAKSYKSIINLIDNTLKQKTIIQMNEPLRYKGFTFYQSSFVEAPGQETTILAVVKNVGRLFPYISSLVICFGLLVHLLLMTPSLFKAKKEKEA